MALVDEITAERNRQIKSEGWDPAHDDKHIDGELAVAAAGYALSAGGFQPEAILEIWPKKWGSRWFKPTASRRDLIKAAALIVAEIERLDRAALSTAESGK